MFYTFLYIFLKYSPYIEKLSFKITIDPNLIETDKYLGELALLPRQRVLCGPQCTAQCNSEEPDNICRSKQMLYFNISPTEQ